MVTTSSLGERLGESGALRNECLIAENRILRQKLPSRLRLYNPARATLAEIGKRLGRRALRMACVTKPDTILAYTEELEKVAPDRFLQGYIAEKEHDCRSNGTRGMGTGAIRSLPDMLQKVEGFPGKIIAMLGSKNLLIYSYTFGSHREVAN